MSSRFFRIVSIGVLTLETVSGSWGGPGKLRRSSSCESLVAYTSLRRLPPNQEFLVDPHDSGEPSTTYVASGAPGLLGLIASPPAVKDGGSSASSGYTFSITQGPIHLSDYMVKDPNPLLSSPTGRRTIHDDFSVGYAQKIGLDRPEAYRKNPRLLRYVLEKKGQPLPVPSFMMVYHDQYERHRLDLRLWMSQVNASTLSVFCIGRGFRKETLQQIFQDLTSTETPAGKRVNSSLTTLILNQIPEGMAKEEIYELCNQYLPNLQEFIFNWKED